MILSTALNSAAGKAGGHPAIIDMGKSISYKDLKEAVGRLSNYYQKENVYGARVALLAPNGIVFAQTFFALANAGNPVFLVNPRETDESIAKDFKLLEIVSVLVSGDQLTRIKKLLQDKGMTHINIIEVEKKRAGEYDTSFQPLPERPLTDADQMLILRQEDSGNERRYCFFTHKQIYLACIAVKRAYRLNANDRIFTKMHWSHPFALTHALLLPLFTGATAAADPDCPSVEEFIEYISTHRITRYVGPPKFFYQLLKYCAAYKNMLPGVKSVTIGLGSVPVAIRKTFKLLKIPVLQCYGCPEAVWSVAMDDLEKVKEGADTYTMPVTGVKLAVLNAQGDELPEPGRREGRLSVSAGSMSSGYFQPVKVVSNTPAATSFRGTWLQTDEIACLEEKGDDLCITVLGKSSDMLLIKGVYKSAERLDEAANRIAGITEAAGFVFHSKDKKPAFACAVVLENQQLTEREILASLKENLPPELHPVKVFFVDMLPRGVYETVDRALLQRQYSTGTNEKAA